MRVAGAADGEICQLDSLGMVRGHMADIILVGLLVDAHPWQLAVQRTQNRQACQHRHYCQCRHAPDLGGNDIGRVWCADRVDSAASRTPDTLPPRPYGPTALSS